LKFIVGPCLKLLSGFDIATRGWYQNEIETTYYWRI